MLSPPIDVWTDPQRGLPVVEYHATADFHARDAVWGFARAGDGEFVIGADRLIVTDGQHVQKIDVPGGYGFRGLAAEPARNRVWAGGVGELGYLEKDASWRFVSLLPQLRAAGVAKPGEISSVQVTSAGIVFVSDQQVFRWEGDKFRVWSLPCAPRLFSFAVESAEANAPTELWIYRKGTGVLRMGPSGPETAIPDSELPDSPLLWAVRLGRDDLLAGSPLGVFRQQKGQWRKLAAASAAVADQLPVCAVRCGPDAVAIGTFQRGVVIVSADDRVLAVQDRKNGLPDDRVHALWTDEKGGLWAGLSEGCVRIANPRVSRFDARNGLAEGPLGEISRDSDAFVVTRRSAYRLIPHDTSSGHASLAPLPAIGAPLWDASLLDGQLTVGGFGGVWRMDSAPEAKWTRAEYASADVYQMILSAVHPHTLFFTEGHSVMDLRMAERGWAPHRLFDDVEDTPLSLLEDTKGDLWISTAIDGIWRLRARDADDPKLRVVAHYETGRGLPPGISPIRLAAVGPAIFAFTEGDILRLNPEGTAFEKAAELADFIPLAGGSKSEGRWVVQRREFADLSAPLLVRVDIGAGGALSWHPIPVEGLDTIGRISEVSVGSAIWISGSEGLLRVREEEPSPAPAAGTGMPGEPSVRFRGVRVDAATRAVAFSYGPSVATTGAPLFYETRLDGVQSAWSAPNREADREFTGLAPGHFTFEVRPVDPSGCTGEPVVFAFDIPAPWWKGRSALACYAAALVLAGGAAFRLRARRQMAALRRRTEELNTLVAERTRELAMSNAAKTEFLENISHEIRNPLNGITGLVTMLQENGAAGREKSLAHSLEVCVRSLTRVFEEVLGFSKLEYGQVAVEEKPFDLAGLVAGIAEMFDVQARQAGCALKVAGSGGRFVGDEAKIRTILANFVGNAVKYAPGRPIEIEDSVDPEARDERVGITISVTDHGPGIPEEEQELIFRKFVRGTTAKETREPGAGLGLATCQALAGLMGGTVGVDSRPGEGATFALQVGLKKATASPENSGGPTSLATAAAPLATFVETADTEVGPPLFARAADANGSNALIVEDQEYNQIVLQRIAERMGYRVETARTGEEALARLGDGKFNLVFLDWELPGLKGDEIARRIRSLPCGADLLILATTANDNEEVRRACLEAGMNGFALKPFDEAIIRGALASAKGGIAGNAPPRSEALHARSRDGQPSSGFPESFAVFEFLGDGRAATTARAAEHYARVIDQELLELEKAWADRDWTRAAQAAHRLRGHAGVVHCLELGEAARALQEKVAGATDTERTGLRAETLRAAGDLRGRVRTFRPKSV